MRPNIPNGIIIEYNLTVVNMDTGNITDYIVDASFNQKIVDRVVSGFSPYQNYNASVSASTIIGAGPVATTTGRTLPDSKEMYIILELIIIVFVASSSPNLVVFPLLTE